MNSCFTFRRVRVRPTWRVAKAENCSRVFSSQIFGGGKPSNYWCEFANPVHFANCRNVWPSSVLGGLSDRRLVGIQHLGPRRVSVNWRSYFSRLWTKVRGNLEGWTGPFAVSYTAFRLSMQLTACFFAIKSPVSLQSSKKRATVESFGRQFFWEKTPKFYGSLLARFTKKWHKFGKVWLGLA